MKLARAKEELHGSYDPATGRRLFHPITGRGPTDGSRNPTQLPVGEYLYERGQEVSEKLADRAQEAHYDAVTVAAASHVSPQSAAIMEQLKAKRLAQVFVYLGGDAEKKLDLLGLLTGPEGAALLEKLDA